MAKKIKSLEQAEKLGLWTYLYSNGDWEYLDTDGYFHLFRDGKELLPDIKKQSVTVYCDGDWEYQDTDGNLHRMEKVISREYGAQKILKKKIKTLEREKEALAIACDQLVTANNEIREELKILSRELGIETKGQYYKYMKIKGVYRYDD